MKDYVLLEVPCEQVPLVWDEAESNLRTAALVNNADDYMRTLKARVFSGMNQLWVVQDENEVNLAFAVSVIYTNDGIVNTAQVYMGTAEDKDVLLAQLDQFESWAVRRDVSRLEITGRKGWEKLLAPHGFKFNYTSLIKEVQRGLH